MEGFGNEGRRFMGGCWLEFGRALGMLKFLVIFGDNEGLLGNF